MTDASLIGLAATCLQELETRGQTLGTAESLTAGLVSATLASVPGASNVLRGGLTAYAVDVKTQLLGVDAAVLAVHGVYSLACAEQMAVRSCAVFACDWGIGTTGVAGPDPDDGHPAGEVYVAVAGPQGIITSRALMLDGDRQEIRESSVAAVLSLL